MKIEENTINARKLGLTALGALQVERSFEIPAGVDNTRTKATFEDGVLFLTLPKMEHATHAPVRAKRESEGELTHPKKKLHFGAN
jgi:HSP20 family molecular chaperone IbpA